jgi:hypothetical protein
MPDLLDESNIFMIPAEAMIASQSSSSFKPEDKSLLNDFFAASRFFAPPATDQVFRFGRMFTRPNLPEFRPEIEGLVDLGIEMTSAVQTADHPTLPAGYTYLGQFIDHDITFDKTKGIPPGILTVSQVVQGRNPSLELDSLYGLGPVLELKQPNGRKIYQPGSIKLRLGRTDPDFSLHFSGKFENDLPRGDNPKKIEQASVADERNDENLGVAQTQVAFIKLHNKVVDHFQDEFVKKNLTMEQQFDIVRREVVLHYQWIVLNDFLPRIIDDEILNHVRRSRSRHFKPSVGEAFVPFEFSFAAFRLGHSMVRETYEWNKFFHAEPPPVGQLGGVADLSELFRRTGFANNDLGGGHARVPGTWIINWTNFFDFSSFPGHQKNPRLNVAKLIDTSLSPTLARLRIPMPMPPELVELLVSKGLRNGEVSLPVINLLRGWLVGVPPAQSVFERLWENRPQLEEFVFLRPADIAADSKSIIGNGLQRLTPLWYYILQEAKKINGGERLGPVGSFIMAEAFVGLIEASNISILRKDKETDPDWRPTLGPIKADRFDMTDLLFFVDDLNPLGDEPSFIHQ